MSLEDMFRAYDIRGRVGKEMTPDIMERIGRAYGTNLLKQHQEDKAVVGYDVRESSPTLHKAFIRGITSTGVDVVDTGFTSYGPVLFAGWRHVLPSAFITASHLSKEWNGVKFAHDTGIGYTEEENQAVADAFFGSRLESGRGHRTEQNVLDAYRQHVTEQVAVEDVNVLMDCGNGSAGVVAPDLFRDAGVDADVMYGEPDGTFPNRDSDVTDENLDALQRRMKNGDHDIGVAYDGDADRVAVVDDEGRLLSAEQLAAVLMQDTLPRESGPVVANVECSRLLEDVAATYNRNVVRVRVGHTYLFKSMKQHGACLGVEKSGHMGIPHVLPLDDGIAASLYAVEVVSKLDRPLSTVVNELPTYSRGRVSYSVHDSYKFEVVQRLQEQLSSEYDNTNTMDGIRIDVDKGWVLIRASNTSPKVRLTVEAASANEFQDLQNEFQPRLRETIIDVERAYEPEPIEFDDMPDAGEESPENRRKEE